ncbi:MAG TPA: protein kinase [Kofleriaceae bacterium]|nr:protein kinase [Kofleriaceae bacterium]
MDDPSNDPRVGSVLQERYRILERLAVGSMGIVYRAERLLLGRSLAVKFLHASYAADPTFIQRFERETRVMGRLAHPHCVSVTDFGVDGGPYVVMEFVDGRTLRSLLEGGRLTVERAALITRQILAGLAHAHELGIIHRDIKPANIMMMDATGTGDHVRILDFGLATLREAHSADISHSAIVIGTPNYMSPEQSVGGKADVRSDVYSTGVVLFELLTGRKPFTSDDTFELLSMHRSAPIPRLANVVPDVDFPHGLQEVIDRALAKAQEDRFQSAMDFAVALDKAIEQPAAPPSRRSRHATRPVFPDEREGRETRAAREAREVREEEADYRQSLGVARSGAMRAPRPRARRRRPGLFAAVVALAIAGGAAWGGHAVWHSEFGARVRAIIERPSPRVSRSAKAGPGAPTPATTGQDRATETAEQATGKREPEAPPADEAGARAAPGETERGSSSGGERAEPAAGGGASEEREPATGADRTAPPAGRDDGAAGGEAATEGRAPAAAGAVAGAGAAANDKSAGEGEGDEVPTEPPLPAEEREEPVAPVGEDSATVDSAEPESAAAVKQPAAGVAPEADSIPGAVALIRAGKREEAIRALIGLRRDQPRSAYVPYLLGNLYFGKGWWTLGMDYYDAAIRSNDLYRGKQILNQNLIRALGSKKTRKKAARMFVNSIGRQSLPFLRQAARGDRDPMVRDWSGWLVWRLTQLSRKRANH